MSGAEALVRRAYEAYAAGDVAAVFAPLDAEVEIVQTPVLPWGGVHRGHAGARTFFRILGEHTAALPAPAQFIVAGDDVAVTGRLRGRARRTGAAIDVAFVHVWTVREGRVVRFAAYIDTPGMLAALGGAGREEVGGSERGA